MVGWTKRVGASRRTAPEIATLAQPGVAESARATVDASSDDGERGLDHAWPTYPPSPAAVVIRAPRAGASTCSVGVSITVEQ
jgi:hypothetical protein